MGWKTGAAAGAAMGAWAGPLGALIGAGIGSVVGNKLDGDGERPLVLTRDGLRSPESGTDIPLEDVHFDSKNMRIILASGLSILCPPGMIGGEDSEKLIAALSVCRDKGRADMVLSRLPAGETGAQLVSLADRLLYVMGRDLRFVEDLKNSADKVNVDADASLKLLQKLVGRLVRALSTEVQELDKIKEWVSKNRQELLRIVAAIESRLIPGNSFNDDVGWDHLRPRFLEGVCLELQIRRSLMPDQVFSSEDYALYHMVSSSGLDEISRQHEAEAVRWLSSDVSLATNAGLRKVIVCTDKPRTPGSYKVELPGVLIMRAETIHAARDAQEGQVETPLMFELGHPRNGMVYVQHPIAKNRYIDIEAFNTTLLERKYDELIRLLQALGATSISCSVLNDRTESSRASWTRRTGCDAEASGKGNGSASFAASVMSERTMALSNKLSCKIERRPNKAPYVPDDILFYQFEDRWQEMAKDVLSGQRTHEEIDLAYNTSYTLSGNETKELGTKIESLIPGYKFGCSANFSEKYAEELKELESIVWHYEVDFKQCGEEAKVMPQSGMDVGSILANTLDKVRTAVRGQQTQDDGSTGKENATDNRAEALILGRVKRFASLPDVKSSGVLSEDQRSELLKLASKYGIEELRVEEIIEEALA